MTAVRRLTANNAIGNVPHMLRNLADEIADGSEGPYTTVFVVCVRSMDEPPELFQFGEEIGRMAEIGAMHGAMAVLSHVEEG